MISEIPPQAIIDPLYVKFIGTVPEHVKTCSTCQKSLAELEETSDDTLIRLVVLRTLVNQKTSLDMSITEERYRSGNSITEGASTGTYRMIQGIRKASLFLIEDLQKSKEEDPARFKMLDTVAHCIIPSGD